MNIQVVPTPPNSQEIHRECTSSPASSAGVDVPVVGQCREDEVPSQPGTATQRLKSNRSQSTFTGQPYQQLKLIDLCTQHEGLYFDCDDLLEFWDNIAAKAPWETTGTQVQSWVEFVCRERKQCLLQGQIPPRREGSEKLDMAIDAWLQITGRKLLQTALTRMRTGSILAFGPEESDEEHLLTKHCRDRLRANMEYMRMQTTRKGKSNRVSGVRLVQAIESIESRVSGQQRELTAHALTPDQFYGPATSRAHENLSPILRPSSQSTAAQTSPPACRNGSRKAASDTKGRAALESRACSPTTARTERNGSFSQPVSTLESLMSDEQEDTENLQREQNRECSIDLGLLDDLGNTPSPEQVSRQQQTGQARIEAFSTFLPTSRNTTTTPSQSRSRSKSQPTRLIIPSASPTLPRSNGLEETHDPPNDDIPMIDLTQSPVGCPPAFSSETFPRDPSTTTCSAPVMTDRITSMTQAQLSRLIAAEVGAVVGAFEERAGTRMDHLEYHFRKLFGITREIRAAGTRYAATGARGKY
ncbi:hypothetical protein F5X96DRAFT_693135 [Biscogniauxia mediterranea]|nr:hypothetical protein F5X96DRAFT_693135 [Biscogniauxia mediterranea]